MRLRIIVCDCSLLATSKPDRCAFKLVWRLLQIHLAFRIFAELLLPSEKLMVDPVSNSEFDSTLNPFSATSMMLPVGL